MTSAGQIVSAGPTPYFVVIDRALRDEGTSYHYAAASEYGEADAAWVALADNALKAAGLRAIVGAAWTTDAPFRETADAIGVDAQSRGILPEPADRALGILNALVGRNLMPRLHPIIGPSRDHSPVSQSTSLRFELAYSPVRPTAAKKENDGGPLVAGFPVAGEVERDLQLGLGSLLVDFFR